VRVLIVGGTGFMGRRAAVALRDAGHDVTVLSRGTRATPAGIHSLVADRRDATALGVALENLRFDFTVDFLAYDAADVEGLLRVPYAALGRYVLISSGQVYLVTENSPAICREEDRDAPLMAEPPVGTPHHDQWSYGVGKRRAEGALLSLRASHGVRGLILRPPSVQGEEDSSLRLWAWLERMLDGGPILLPDGGSRPVRFLYAGDIAQALVRLADGPTPREAAYNLAPPDLLPLREFLERVARAAGVTPTFVDVSWEECDAAGLDRGCAPYAGPWTSVLDASRAAGEWGFTGTRVDDYLPRVVAWHLEHRPAASHPAYSGRARELELAARLATPERPS
jgi:nucleoside-diphosphate-sugar epimerase